MANRSSYLVAWIAGGAGVILLYSAYKNVGPVSVITGRLSGDDTRTNIDTAVAGAGGSFTPTDTSDGGGGGGFGARGPDGYSKDDTRPVTGQDLTRTQRLAARTLPPTLAPIPTQPNILLDISAVGSFLKVQAAYGGLIKLTGGYRSTADQAAGHARNPSAFVEAGKSLHEVGLAVDVNTDAVNVNDPRLIQAFAQNGWFRVGKSGPMHWSYGVAG